jgi:hypothetical protein
MTTCWISQNRRHRWLTIHAASCYMCRDGRGFHPPITVVGSSATDGSQTWHGPQSNVADAYRAATELLSVPSPTTIRDCGYCKPSLMPGVLAEASKTTDLAFWLNVRGDRPRTTIHLSSCALAYRHLWPGTPHHGGAIVDAAATGSGWYGPYPSLADARSAARYFQANRGAIVASCLRCARTARLDRLEAEMSAGLPQAVSVSDPAVPIGRSLTRDHIFCLECGQPRQLLILHLSRVHRIRADEYRR